MNKIEYTVTKSPLNIITLKVGKMKRKENKLIFTGLLNYFLNINLSISIDYTGIKVYIWREGSEMYNF